MKYIIISAFFCILVIQLFAGKKRKVTKVKKEEIENTIPPPVVYVKPVMRPLAKFPSFSMVDNNNKVWLASDMDSTSPKALVLFNPGCGHCKDLIGKIKDSMSMVQDVKFYFICGLNLLEHMPKFVEETKTKELKNMVIGVDNSEITNEIFDYNGIPQIMLYNKKQQLQKIFFKEITMDSLSYYVHKN